MLKKKQRLNGKDIAYILRKGQKVYGKFLVFRFIPQYRNLSYRQASIQIPVKLDKRATTRNLLKRKALLRFEEAMKEKEMDLMLRKSYFKVFIFVNKQALTPLKEALESEEKTSILRLRESGCKQDFTLFIKNLGKISGNNFKRGWNKPRRGGKNSGKRNHHHISNSKR